MGIIFQTRFNVPLNIDFPDSNPSAPDTGRIFGRGIDGGYALTCNGNAVTRKIAPYLGSTYTNLTTRLQFGLAGNVTDSASGIGTVPGLIIAGWGDPISIDTNNTSGFQALLTVRQNGAIMLYITSGDNSGTQLNATSAAGVLIYDGRMNGIQVSFSITSHTTVVYNVVVNNVSVVSGTYTANRPVSAFSCPPGGKTTWLINCVERAAITSFDLLVGRLPPGGTFHFTESVAEVQIEDSVNIISYPPCNAINAVESDPCSSIGVPTTGTLVVTKTSVPDSGLHSFSFTTVGGLSPSTFSLLTGQSQVFNSVAPGVYSIIEDSDTAWNPVYSVSSGGTDNLNITIVAGSNIVVTVTNVPKPDISGLYAIIPIKTHDTYNGPIEKKIPNPTIKSALIGE